MRENRSRRLLSVCLGHQHAFGVQPFHFGGDELKESMLHFITARCKAYENDTASAEP